MSTNLKFERSPHNSGHVDQVLNEIWGKIQEKNLYSGQPRAQESVQALALSKTALSVAARTKVRNHSAHACRMMAMTLNANEQYFASIRYYRRALTWLDSLGNREQAARTRLGFVAALGMLGRYQEAVDHAENAGEYFEKSGDDHGHARLLTNLGNVHLRREDYEEALQCHSRAYEFFKSTGDEKGQVISGLNLGNCLSQLGHFDRAEEIYSQAEALSRKLELDDLNRQVRYNRNYLTFLRGDCDEALRGLKEMKHEFRKVKSARHSGLCDLDSAEIYVRKRMPAATLRHARKAARVFGMAGMRYEQAKAVVFAAAAFIETHKFKKALSALQSAQELFKAEGNTYWMIVLDVWQAYVRVALRQTATARALLNRAGKKLQQIDTKMKRFESIKKVLATFEQKPLFMPEMKFSEVLHLM